MVDILDMEDIFYDIIRGHPYLTLGRGIAKDLAHKIILEVADYVEGQQTIKCNNCELYCTTNTEGIPWSDLD